MRLIPNRRATGAASGVLALAVALSSACQPASHSQAGVTVVASFYPLAEAARQVGGGGITVENLTRPGAEPHDLELSPSQVADLQDADAVIDMGHGFQPAVERAARGNQHRLVVLEAIATAGHENDPHVWLDPTQMSAIVARVAALLEKVDRPGRATYAANADRYRAKLASLDGRYRAGLASCVRHEIVTSHEAFGWLAARYGLHQVAISGLNPESEPTPQKLADLADLVRRHGVTTVFTETLLSPRSADALSREAGVHTEVLDPLEGLTTVEVARGAEYVSVMDENLTKIRTALGCR